MGIYTKIMLSHERDIKLATRSIYSKCRQLHHSKQFSNITASLNKDGMPIILNTLQHCQALVDNSIKINGGDKFLLDYKNSLNKVIEEIEKKYTASLNYTGTKVPLRRLNTTTLAHFVRKHKKFFERLKVYKNNNKHKINIEPDNNEWINAQITAIIIWGNNGYN